MGLVASAGYTQLLGFLHFYLTTQVHKWWWNAEQSQSYENHYVWQYFADTNHVEANKWAAKSATCIFCDKMQHFQGSSKDLRAPCLSLVDDGHWLIFMIDSLLFSISVFSTDLQRIQTPHSLFWDFIADKTIITSWSGGRVQVWIQVRAPDSHLAFTPKGYSRRK